MARTGSRRPPPARAAEIVQLLRLQEARRLVLSMMMDAGTASRHVGYVSLSQFSRDNGRFFGSPATKDIPTLREHVVRGAEA